MTNNTYIEKLEFNKILEKLSDYCVTYLGKELAKNLKVSNDINIVKLTLKETEEAVNLIYKNSTPPLLAIADIGKYLKILESGMLLTNMPLLQLAQIFKTAQELKKYFNKEYINTDEFPILSSIFSNLYNNLDIQNKIFSSIIDEETIDDKASVQLQKIRKKEKNVEQDIRNKLNNMIHSSQFSKYLQESIITIRNDRFVIPIKEEYRSQVKGFIHDVSNAGSTIFIEPISIFELNNELSQLKLEEEIEIEKILQELTNLFIPYIEELKTDVETIGKLDFIFAKAKYSKDINGITPIINKEKIIELKNARHPLIDKEKVVPISIELGKDYKTLVITGPNTGGKTVTLKTVGLLTCMACSGLNIPTSEKSSIYVFDKIFADIGDAQSIADSLSTFSSHMLNIVDIANHANSNSLILVDELGSGTDPLEGANLAIAILDYFKNKGALTIATTHYQELKKYALTTKEFENASVEFNVDTLSPTYKLLIGIPGKSNAFAISKKLGLDEDIIEKAKSLMSKKDIDFEALLKNIYDNKSKLEEEKTQIESELQKVTELKTELEKQNNIKKAQEKEIINNAKIKARNILLEAKEEATEIIKEMSNTSNNKELEKSRNKLNEKIKNIKLVKSSDEAHLSNTENTIDVKDITPNMKVYVTNLNKEGIVLSHVSKNNEVQVQIGSMKMSINIRNLQKVKGNSNTETNAYSHVPKARNVKTEINVIGMTVEEANFVIDKFLDDSVLANLETVRIVHGKGTGKLRKGIHEFLKTNPHVKSFRLGNFGEGEMGVTVVNLR